VRIVVGLLVVANLLAFAWLQGWIATPGDDPGVRREDRQVNAGLLTVETVPGAATPATD
jgi:hypothetical protein